ncbi:MAG: serine/threonine-protein kinase [Firmicutes bacterium]|nr:serine/threonine-protein kinase [Bacillota bacterium]
MYRKLLSVSCPNLPKIMEAAEQDGMVAVLEEYIPGDSLAYLLAGACLTPAQARKITLQLCNALWVLHAMGAVHRDNKPENVIIRGSEAVLIDFDASRIFKNDTNQDTQILGTTGYAAPEQYGITQTDERADIYSLGVLLNIMLTGKHPSRELASGKLGHVVQKCTMVNPKKRYKSVLYLMEAL